MVDETRRMIILNSKIANGRVLALGSSTEQPELQYDTLGTTIKHGVTDPFPTPTTADMDLVPLTSLTVTGMP